MAGTLGRGALIMDQKNYLTVTAMIFAVVALAHLVRAAMGLSVVIAGWIVPMWLSWAAFVVAGGLSYFGWTLAKK